MSRISSGDSLQVTNSNSSKDHFRLKTPDFSLDEMSNAETSAILNEFQLVYSKYNNDKMTPNMWKQFTISADSHIKSNSDNASQMNQASLKNKNNGGESGIADSSTKMVKRRKVEHTPVVSRMTCSKARAHSLVGTFAY